MHSTQPDLTDSRQLMHLKHCTQNFVVLISMALGIDLGKTGFLHPHVFKIEVANQMFFHCIEHSQSGVCRTVA
ncbi:hypothetical protein WS75_26385 [Burkholderia sp. FL-7-2-10-S1-D7]|nr:hypothetical protein WS75_26385 [Burkholderia sp. FL-7-2-10-S1-D7]